MPEIKEIAVTQEKPEKSQKERATLEKFNQLADHIIQAFTVPKRVPLYTQENSDHLISYEESELRLIIIGIFTSCILSLISLILLKIWLDLMLQTTKFFEYETPQGAPPLPFMLLYNSIGNGTIAKYHITKGLTLHFDKFLKLPNSKKPTKDVDELGFHGNIMVYNAMKRTHFLGLTDHRNVFMITTDGHKDVTFIDSNTMSHGTLVGRKYPYQPSIWMSITRCSNVAWVLNGIKQNVLVDLKFKEFEPAMSPKHFHPESYIWSVKKQRFYQGPNMPDFFHASCALSINRTHALLIVLKPTSHNVGLICLAVWMFNWETWIWKDMNWCFNSVAFGSFVKLSCTHFFNKKGKLSIIVWHNDIIGGDLNGMSMLDLDGSYQKFDLANQSGFGNVHFIHLRGVVFMISSDHMHQTAKISVLQNATLIKQYQILEFTDEAIDLVGLPI